MEPNSESHVDESMNDFRHKNIPETNATPEGKERWKLKDIKGFVHFHSWEGSSCGKDNLIQIKDAIAKKTGLQKKHFVYAGIVIAFCLLIWQALISSSVSFRISSGANSFT